MYWGRRQLPSSEDKLYFKAPHIEFRVMTTLRSRCISTPEQVHSNTYIPIIPVAWAETHYAFHLLSTLNDDDFIKKSFYRWNAIRIPFMHLRVAMQCHTVPFSLVALTGGSHCIKYENCIIDCITIENGRWTPSTATTCHYIPFVLHIWALSPVRGATSNEKYRPQNIPCVYVKCLIRFN